MLTRRELLIGAIAAGAPMHVGLRKKILVDNPAKLYGF